MYSFPNLDPVCCSMSSSNCCFLTCIQISQEAAKVVWYAHLFQNFPQFIVIHTDKSFGIVNKAEADFFWNSLAFLMIQQMLAIWSPVALPFLNPACAYGSISSLGCRFFLVVDFLPFIPFDESCHSLLGCRVSAEKSTDNLREIPGYVICCSSHCCF